MQISTRYFNAIFIIFLCSTEYAFAQGDFGPPPGGPQVMTANDIAEIQTVWMKKKLKLNTEQSIKADTINKKYVAAMQEYQKADKKSPEKLAALNKERDDNLKDILTDKQFGLYLKKKDMLNNSISNSNNQSVPPPPPRGF